MTLRPSLPPEGKQARSRRRRLKSLAILPTLLTLGNLLCGFAAIHFAARGMFDPADVVTLGERTLPPPLSIAAGLVFLGMVFDAFDGLVARATRSTTDFGGQLDSLADMITCGVAPAALMVSFLTAQLAREQILVSPLSVHFLGRATWIAAAVYVALTAVRLARYNVEHARADFDYRTFRGLPSPGAAAVIAAMVIFQDEMGAVARYFMVYALPVAGMALALLMVSRLPYRRFYRAYLVGRRPFGQIAVFVFVFAAFWLFKAPTLLLIVIWYALSGPVDWLIRARRERGAGSQELVASTDSGDQVQRRA